MKNPQYSLLIIKDTADVTYFSNADHAVNKEEALLWQIIKDNPNCYAENVEHAEKLILENPYNVYFASEVFASWELKHFPCLIDSTSNVLATVLGNFKVLMTFGVRQLVQPKCSCRHIRHKSGDRVFAVATTEKYMQQKLQNYKTPKKKVPVATFKELVATCGEWRQGWTTLV